MPTVRYQLFHRRAKPDAAATDFAATVVSLPAGADSLPVADSLAASDSLPATGEWVPSDIDAGAHDSAPDSQPDSQPVPVELRPTLAYVGRYALKGLLADGGLGQVHEAWDPLLSRVVAVKMLQFDTDPAAHEQLDELFLNEARAAAGLSHAHIVTVHDAGLSEHGVYIAMERLQGQDLRQRLAGGWQPTPAQAALLVRRVADALSYAHARGVVHCDIKPSNIFLNKRDKPKVLDFGIARIANSRALPFLDGAVAGSPHYLAPEQLLGQAVDARTDIHALGVVFYELLTLRKAFNGDSVEQINTAVLTNHPAPANEVRPGVPRTLAGVAAKAMAREPAARYASAAEMSADLRRWADRHGVPDSAGANNAPRPAAAPVASLARTTRAQPLAARGIAVVALLLGFVGLVWLATRSQTAAVAKPPPAAVAAAPLPAPLSSAPLSPAPGPAAALPPALTPALGAAAPASASGLAASAAAPGPATADGAASLPAATAPVAAPARPETPTRAAAPVRTERAAAPAARTKTATLPAAHEARSGTTLAAAAPVAAAPPPMGVLQLAISPWGQVEVDGQPMGATPPLTRLNLSEGSHSVTVRNEDFPPLILTVQVQAHKPVTVRHRFNP